MIEAKHFFKMTKKIKSHDMPEHLKGLKYKWLNSLLKWLKCLKIRVQEDACVNVEGACTQEAVADVGRVLPGLFSRAVLQRCYHTGSSVQMCRGPHPNKTRSNVSSVCVCGGGAYVALALMLTSNSRHFYFIFLMAKLFHLRNLLKINCTLRE